MNNHASSSRAYFITYLALMVLLGLTVAVAHFHLGPWALTAALVIAATKATIVALFFMHLVHTKHRTQLAAGAGILWLAILITLTLSDVLTRSWFPQPKGW